jgi:hypothetical protein
MDPTLISSGVAAATNAIESWINTARLHGDQRIATTEIVNRLEILLRNNRDAFLNGPRTAADQQAALATFDSGMDWLASPSGCGNIAYSRAGLNCVNERQRGAKFDWYAWYRDPIANAEVSGPGLVVSGTNGSGATSAILPATANNLTVGINWPLLAIGLLALFIVVRQGNAYND